jgi:hypothetical protein
MSYIKIVGRPRFQTLAQHPVEISLCRKIPINIKYNKEWHPTTTRVHGTLQQL